MSEPIKPSRAAQIPPPPRSGVPDRETGTPSGSGSGRYEVGKRRWPHPMGEVFEATDVQASRAVTLTVLRPGTAIDPTQLASPLVSTRRLRTVKDPALQLPLDTEQFPPGKIAIITEFTDAAPLSRLVIGRALPTARAIAILQQVSRALRVMHDAGTRHSILTVGSVLLEANADGADIVRLTDLGLATLVHADLRVSQASAALQAISPERALGVPADAREDQYLLGCLAYTMLTGGPPFRTGSVEAIARRHAIEDPMPIEQRLRGQAPPQALLDVIHRCLEKHPDDRYPNLAAFERELAEATTSPPSFGTLRNRTASVMPSDSSPSIPIELDVPPIGLEAPVQAPLRGTQVSTLLAQRARRASPTLRGPNEPPSLPEAFPVHAAFPEESQPVIVPHRPPPPPGEARRSPPAPPGSPPKAGTSSAPPLVRTSTDVGNPPPPPVRMTTETGLPPPPPPTNAAPSPSSDRTAATTRSFGMTAGASRTTVASPPAPPEVGPVLAPGPIATRRPASGSVPVPIASAPTAAVPAPFASAPTAAIPAPFASAPTAAVPGPLPIASARTAAVPAPPVTTAPVPSHAAASGRPRSPFASRAPGPTTPAPEPPSHSPFAVPAPLPSRGRSPLSAPAPLPVPNDAGTSPNSPFTVVPTPATTARPPLPVPRASDSGIQDIEPEAILELDAVPEPLSETQSSGPPLATTSTATLEPEELEEFEAAHTLVTGELPRQGNDAVPQAPPPEPFEAFGAHEPDPAEDEEFAEVSRPRWHVPALVGAIAAVAVIAFVATTRGTDRGDVQDVASSHVAEPPAPAPREPPASPEAPAPAPVPTEPAPTEPAPVPAEPAPVPEAAAVKPPQPSREPSPARAESPTSSKPATRDRQPPRPAPEPTEEEEVEDEVVEDEEVEPAPRAKPEPRTPAPVTSGKTATELAAEGNALFNRGAYREASQVLEAAVKADRDNGQYRILLGDAYYKLGNTASARKHYEKAQALGNGAAERRLAKLDANSP